MTNPFQNAFDAYAPALATDFVAYHIRVITRLIAKYEGKLFGLGNSSDADGGAYRNSRSYIEYDGNRTNSLANGVNLTRLQKDADEYARFAIESFVAKLTKKLAALTGVEVKRADGATFVITGMLGERRVRVEQTQVFKVSSKGTPFHQWPARIYVDGKFTSEAAFKKLAA